MRRRRFTGIARLPSALPVAADALGLVQKITIGGRKATIALPQLEPSTRNIVAPSELENQPLTEALLKTAPGHWASNSPSEPYYVYNVAISLLLTPTSSMEASPEYQEMGKIFLDWFDIVRDWAAFSCGEPLHEHGRSPSLVISVIGEYGVEARTGAMVSRASFGAIQLSLTQLRGAFRRASRGEHLPSEYQLLQSANLALRTKDLRRAVIDAGTAAEVALTAAITRKLDKNTTREFVELSIKNANGVVGLIELYTSLGGTVTTSKNKAMNQLAAVRNRAAHGGHAPTEDEITTAMQHARNIVLDACPFLLE